MHSQRFIHRNYHPGNVLWERGRVSGLDDWLVDVFTRHAERALDTQWFRRIVL